MQLQMNQMETKINLLMSRKRGYQDQEPQEGTKVHIQETTTPQERGHE